MKEDFLQYLWKFTKFNTQVLTTTQGLKLSIYNVGSVNTSDGPDFFNAKISIGNQLWAGNIEIHTKSSNWYMHGHEKDKNYDNVILHVVWEHDVEVFIGNYQLPTLQLKDYISIELLEKYNQFFRKANNKLHCEKHITQTPSLIIKNWWERLYIERLEQKSEMIFEELKKSANNWEAVLYILLFKNFGLNINGNSFYQIAKQTPFEVIRKVADNLMQLEALFMGQAGLLENPVDIYAESLQKEYIFLKHKFGLESIKVPEIKFSRLRPANFPTIRLAQLAFLYHHRKNLFSKIINTDTFLDYKEILTVQTSSYWKNHYTFNTISKETIKNTATGFIELLIINTIIPIKFCYAQFIGKDINDALINIIGNLPAEKNAVIHKFKDLQVKIPSALESQAILQCYTKYCSNHKCLQCAVGNYIIN